MTAWYRRFFRIQECLCLEEAPVSVHPDFDRPFVLQCDASTCGTGAVLAKEDNNGIKIPIAFIPHKLNKSQMNCSITGLEWLAVVKAIVMFVTNHGTHKK